MFVIQVEARDSPTSKHTNRASILLKGNDMIEFLKQFNTKPIWMYNNKDWLLGIVIAIAAGVFVAVGIELILMLVT